MTRLPGPDPIDEQIVAPLRRVEVTLDEPHRVRMGAAIEEGLDARARERREHGASERTSSWHWRGRAVVAGALAIGGLAAAAWVVAGLRTAGRPEGAATRLEVVLAPYLYSGPGAARASLRSSSRLTVPAGARVRAAIDTRVRLTLVGPGRLSVEQASAAGDIDLVLDDGALYVDYDGSGGGVLRVRSPGVVTTVVGTLFSVEAESGSTRVGVTRGSVRTQVREHEWRLGAGSVWDAKGRAVSAIPAALAAALSAHDASAPPPVGEFGLLEIGDDDRAGAAGNDHEMTLDGRALAALPLVARIPAGRHTVGGPEGTDAVEVARGANVRVDAAQLGASPRVPDARAKPPAPAVAGQATATGAYRPRRHLRKVAVAAPSGGPSFAPAPAPVPPASAVTPPLADLESIYAGAENDLRNGHRERARRGLQEILAREPAGARAETVLLDLARLALAEGNPGEARGYLARMPARTADAALAEPADHLRCTTELRLGDGAAARACLTAFRRRYPHSAHDAEALAHLAAQSADCPRALPLLQEYLRRYPRGQFAADARVRLDACCADCQ